MNYLLADRREAFGHENCAHCRAVGKGPRCFADGPIAVGAIEALGVERSVEFKRLDSCGAAVRLDGTEQARTDAEARVIRVNVQRLEFGLAWDSETKADNRVT